MSELVAARAQMGTSLAFHIIFASLGVGLPLLLCITECGNHRSRVNYQLCDFLRHLRGAGKHPDRAAAAPGTCTTAQAGVACTREEE